MKVLLSWLNDFGPFADPSDESSVETLADEMTALGLAVESIDRIGSGVDGVISAKVLRVEQHPDAAKVRRVWVDAGEGQERHVWCGASNMAAGDVVALATLGTQMPDGRTIERRGILGIDSEGMLCSETELGIGSDGSGIMILPADAPLGVAYTEAIGLEDDVIFDLDLTRNRPDCWSVRGIARDLAAHRRQPLASPPAGADYVEGAERSVPVALEAGDRCGRFTTTVLSNLAVTESPEWIARRLTSVGMRPINNVVDASNYVMLELGQPNHAYDHDAVSSGLRIRQAKSDERITTLDGVERVCVTDDLLICDASDAPVGIGGVMGGADSEIADSTTEVALEVAWFESMGIMRTATRHALRSEASARYERGVDPAVADDAIQRFASLLALTCPNLVLHAGTVDERGSALPSTERSVEVRVSAVNRVLGTEFIADDLPPLLDRLGLRVAIDDDRMSVAIPSWRPDISGEIDVVEEVARMFGYDRLGRSVPRAAVHGHLSAAQRRRRELRRVLVGLGVSEAMPNPFVASDTMALAGVDGPTMRILNPLVAEESALRTSLRPGLLAAVAHNEHHRREGVSLFEIGHVYPPGDGDLPDEYEALCVVLAGRNAHDAVAAWREIAAALGTGAMIDQGTRPGGLHPTRSAVLRSGRDVIGVIGEIAPDVAGRFGVSERVAVFEVRLDGILASEPRPASHRVVSRMPTSDLDLAFVMPDDTPAERLERALRQAAGDLLVSCELFDVYRGQGVDPGTRSLAFRLRLQQRERNITDADIAAVRERCIAGAERLDATLRG
ncbi:MAG: phenylalanine--tRNA ligase subunit beta [Actinomycetota bacterium]|nr:phenylalanine--tRNA ligase subunit beta [Actinomycetota bacterium]